MYVESFVAIMEMISDLLAYKLGIERPISVIYMFHYKKW